MLGLGQVDPPFPLASSSQTGGVTYLKVSSVFDCYFVCCLGFLEARAFTELSEADILVNFVDSFIPVVTRKLCEIKILKQNVAQLLGLGCADHR